MQNMSKAKYMVVSGFLGAGKTTSMLAFARCIDSRGGKAAILANDLGAANIVDADFTAESGVLSTSIAGDCICYQHENLVDKLRRLASCGAGVIFSDIPGCGIGALDHVYLQLAEKEGDEFELLPFTCIVDPERLKMLMPEPEELNLPSELRFLLDAQMREAELIVLNKTDAIGPEQREKCLGLIRTLFPDTPLMSMSAKTGEGVGAVADYILSHRSAAEHREIGYGSEAFIAAESRLSWYNRRVYFERRDSANIDFNAVLTDIFEGIRAGLKAAGGNVPHLKIFAAGEGPDYFKASLTGVDYGVEYDRLFDGRYTALSVIINARAAAGAEAMGAAADGALDAAAEKHGLRVRTFFLESFGMTEEGRGNGGKASRF